MAKYEEWLTEDGLLQIVMWAEDGADNQELAKAMGISRSTFNEWRRRFPVISDAVMRGRRCALVQIRNALRERAKGGVQTLRKPRKRRVREYDPTTGKCIRDEEIFEYVDEEEYVPPDTNAIKFYLTNKDAEHFAEKIDVTGDGTLRLEDVLGDG